MKQHWIIEHKRILFDLSPVPILLQAFFNRRVFKLMCFYSIDRPNLTIDDLTVFDSYMMTLIFCQYICPLSILSYAYARMCTKLWRNQTPGNAQAERDETIILQKRRCIKSMISVVLWWFLVFAGYLTMGFTAQPSFFPVLLIGKKVILWSKIFFFKFFILQFSACQSCLFCLSLVRYEQQLLQSVHLRHSWSK